MTSTELLIKDKYHELYAHWQWLPHDSDACRCTDTFPSKGKHLPRWLIREGCHRSREIFFLEALRRARKFVEISIPERAENEIASITDRLDVTDGKREMGADKAWGGLNLQQFTTGHETIARGAQLEHGWTLNDVTAEEAAVFLLVLRVWVAGGSSIGELQHKGFGTVKGYYDLTITECPSRFAAPVRAGRLSFEYETGIEIDCTDESLRKMFDVEQALIKENFGNWKHKAT